MSTPAESVLPHLGTFWAGHYPDQDRMSAWCAAVADVLAGLDDTVAWAGACAERLRVPLGRPRRWWPVPLTSVTPTGDYPTDLAGCAALCDAPGRATRILVPGVDFTIRNGHITFHGADPGAMTMWWAWCATLASADFQRQWGHLLGVPTPATPAWRTLLNAVLDAWSGGTSMRELGLFLGAALGQPVADVDQTIESVLRDEDGWTITTDTACYRVTAGADPAVTVGDRVAPGQSLGTGLRIDEPRGRPPDWLRYVAIEAAARDEVVYARGQVPVHEMFDRDGTRRQSFALGGRPDTVAAYWAACHARTPNPELPAELDPLELLFSGPWASGVVAVRIDAGAIPVTAPGLAALPLVRTLLTPETILLVAIDLPPLDDPNPLSGDDGTDWLDVAPVAGSEAFTLGSDTGEVHGIGAGCV